jgi:hypothetical protein
MFAPFLLTPIQENNNEAKNENVIGDGSATISLGRTNPSSRSCTWHGLRAKFSTAFELKPKQQPRLLIF